MIGNMVTEKKEGRKVLRNSSFFMSHVICHTSYVSVRFEESKNKEIPVQSGVEEAVEEDFKKLSGEVDEKTLSEYF